MLWRSLVHPASKTSPVFRYSSYFISGYINGAAFIACASFVSHVTGFTTQIGVFLAQQDWSQVLEAIGVPICFIFGSVAAAFLAPEDDEFHHELHYVKVLRVMAICLALVALGGHLDLFSKIGNIVHMDGVFICIDLLAFTSGLQNGMVTIISEGTVRSTHLTGLLTDIGLGLNNGYLSSESAEDKLQEKRLLHSRLLSLVTFLTGTIFGALFYVELEYLTFIIPSILAIGLMIHAQTHQLHPASDVSLYQRLWHLSKAARRSHRSASQALEQFEVQERAES